MHISKMCFIVYYYSQTCFGLFYDHLQGVTKDHTMYRSLHRAQLKPPYTIAIQWTLLVATKYQIILSVKENVYVASYLSIADTHTGI